MPSSVDPALAERRLRESLEVQGLLAGSAAATAIVEASELVARAVQSSGKLLTFGNGGSAADATHIAAELVGRFLAERRALPAVSLGDNTPSLTAIANDYAYDRVFARQVEALGRPGDVALGISTSGRSANVVAGLEAAREAGLATIGLTGGDGGDLPGLCDVCVIAPSAETPRVQECHVVLIHVLCELVENSI